MHHSLQSNRLRYRLGRWPIIVALGALYAASQTAILSIIEPLGPQNVLRLQTTFSADEFRVLKDGWTELGVIGAYWHHFILDFPHPVWYGLFSAACIARALQFSRRSQSYDVVILLPIVAGSCDLVENLLHVAFLLSPGLIRDPVVAVSALFTHAKWLLMALSNLLLLALLAVGVVLHLRSSSDD